VTVGWREKINEHAGPISIACAVFVMILLYRAFTGGTAGRVDRSDPGAWYYVPDTGVTFVDSDFKLAPIQSPDGHEAVRVWSFACGPCTNQSRFVGYYAKYPDDVKRRAEAARDAGTLDATELWAQRLVSSDGVEWRPAASPEGQAIMAAADRRCDDVSKLRPCWPK